MSGCRELLRRRAPTAAWTAIREVLAWRPRTLLDHLLLLAVFGIVIATFLIVGVRLHLVHRLL